MDFKDCVLGIELGSTRIKAVLIDGNHIPVASGGYNWENKLCDGVWTYDLCEAERGLQGAFASLSEDVCQKFGRRLDTVGYIGVSGMMHGYLPFDSNDRLLSRFRTWRNTFTAAEAEELSKLFHFNIPQRWSISHLYNEVRNGAKYLDDLCFMTTLSGYIHYKLTGQKVIGMCEASGMFPVDSSCGNFNKKMMSAFENKAREYGFTLDLSKIFPKVLSAGEPAGSLTKEGALLLDPTGTLREGIPFCPPEGDGGTGMVATNSIAVGTGNVSAGTSIFASIILGAPLTHAYKDIDVLCTPDGTDAAMVHCNNCSSELNAWVSLFSDIARMLSAAVPTEDVFSKLFLASLEGEADCSGIVPVGYLSGEHVTGFESGRPLLLRHPESVLSVQNFMRSQIYSAVANLCFGLELLKQEGVTLTRVVGHGGLFKTPGVAQSYLAAALEASVTCLETAGEGGAYGVALLAAYAKNRKAGETLAEYLDLRVFSEADCTTVIPDESSVAGFKAWFSKYRAALKAERAAVDNF